MVLVDRVPLLQLNLRVVRAGLSGNELLQIAYSVIRAAFDAHFAT